MMINKRLIGTVNESKKYIAENVLAQWCSLLCNIILMWTITDFLAALFFETASQEVWIRTICISVIAICGKHFLTLISSKMSWLSGKTVKIKLRQMIYEKLLKLGSSYNEKVQTSEIVQVAVDGVNQLETYFGAYLPQFFYAMLAPLTLFIVLSFVSFKSAIILLICVPLIPISIAAVQTWAKKLLSKYWDKYTGLGDTFLENLQGLTTLKIYKADEMKHKEMNEEAENFRKITMKVLTMQLNSITIMDLVAYGGAALGIIVAVTELNKGAVDMVGCLRIILLSADFFIPMRMLGSFFHIAMNGMAASDKIFNLLDIEDEKTGAYKLGDDCSIKADNVIYSYDNNKDVLKNVSMEFPKGSFTAIVGESGCGKSTFASILMSRNKGYKGKISVGGYELSKINEESLMKNITYISHQSYLFRGTVRDNLLLANSYASDAQLIEALERVNLYNFLKTEKGLDTVLTENGANLSGGQRQRLALARAILHNSPVYIFDEATSNIDVESENDIMKQVYKLAEEKTVIVISHRLANTVSADNIYVMEKGQVKENGTHEFLLSQNGIYSKLWSAQQELEKYIGEEQ